MVYLGGEKLGFIPEDFIEKKLSKPEKITSLQTDSASVEKSSLVLSQISYQSLSDEALLLKSDSAENVLPYRKLPYQDVINYKTKEVVIDSAVVNYVGGYLSYKDGKADIYINTFIPSEAFKNSAEFANFKPELEFLNSKIQRQFTLYHEYTHFLNNLYGLNGLSRKDEILIGKYDEISASLSELLIAREIYLETGWDTIFRGKLSFYADALKTKKISPKKGMISAEEASFMINGLSEVWQKNLEMHYALKEVAQTKVTTTEPMSEENLKKIITPFFLYELNGQKINFLDYLKTKLELTTLELISINSQEIG